MIIEALMSDQRLNKGDDLNGVVLVRFRQVHLFEDKNLFGTVLRL